MKKMIVWLAIVLPSFTINGLTFASEPQDISLIQLIATPELFNGREIRVIGFLHLEFEGDALYLHREDFEHSITQNSIAIELSQPQDRVWRKLGDQYAIIEGKFSSISKGHLGARPGSLQEITRLGGWRIKRSPKKITE